VNTTGLRNTALTVVGLAAWLLYILACGPAFSPDDKKVLFPSIDARTGATTLAMYDRAAKTTRTLFVPRDSEQAGSVGEEHDGMSISSAWSPDGRQAIAYWAESKEDLRIAVIPIAGGDAVRLLYVPDVGDATRVVTFPPAIVGGRLFVPMKERVVRIELATGERTSKEAGLASVVEQGGRLFYSRDLPRASDKEPQRWEIGRLDPETLAATPIVQSDEKSSGVFGVSEDGSRLAVEQEEDVWSILVFDGARMTRRIPLGTKEAPIVLFNLIWSRDNSRLHAAYGKETPDAPNEFGVAEVPVDGTAPQYTPLFRAEISPDDSGGVFQVDLSHDGRTLAAASTFLALFGDHRDRVKPEDLALYLVDLSRRDRRVTKIAIPVPPAKR
jgi:hypothetical protein